MSQLDISLLSQPSSALFAELERLQTTEMSNVEKEKFERLILDALSHPSAPQYAKSTAAYLAGRFRLASALPVLLAHFTQDWTGAKSGSALYRCNPDTALLMYGSEALPGLKDVIRNSDQIGAVQSAALLLNNILGSKAAAKQFLVDVQQEAQPNVKKAIDGTLVAMESWGGPI